MGANSPRSLRRIERIASSNAVILVFKVEEGAKVKVGRIHFTGNHAFSDRKLIRAMRHDRPYAIPMYFSELGVSLENLRQRQAQRRSRGRRSRPLSGQRLFSRAGQRTLLEISTPREQTGGPVPLMASRMARP